MKRSMRAPLTALIALSLLVTPARAREFAVSERTVGLRGADVAHDPDREAYLVQWWVNPSSQESSHVYVRAVRNAVEGVEIGPVQEVAEQPRAIFVARLGKQANNGSYLAVWELTGRTHHRVLGRLLSADGEPVSEVFPISPADDICEGRLFGVAYSIASDRWLVAWVSGAVGSRGKSCERVRARFVDSRGRVGKEIESEERGSIRSGGDVAYSAAAEAFLIVWTEGQKTVYGRLVKEPLPSSPEGDLLFAASEEGCIGFPRVAAGAAGRWLVLWHDDCLDGVEMLVSRTLEPNRRMTRARLVRSARFALSSALGFSEKSGRFVAGWTEADGSGRTGRDVYSRPFKRRGRPLGPSRPVGRRTHFFESYPRLACSEARAECLHVWVRDQGRLRGNFVRPRRTDRR